MQSYKTLLWFAKADFQSCPSDRRNSRRSNSSAASEPTLAASPPRSHKLDNFAREVFRYSDHVTNHIAILAPGLLGASVAQAARHFGAAQRITLWARRPETRQELKGQTWCDHVADSAADAVKGAQLTIICSPVDQIIPLLTTIAPHLATGSFVTDVGSVKTEICQKGHSAIFPQTLDPKP